MLAHGFFPLIASNFAPAKLTLAIRLFYGLLPIVLFTGIATNCTAVLNTLDRFALPALAPAVISIPSSFARSFSAPVRHLGHGLRHACRHAATRVIVVAHDERHGYRFNLRWHGMNPAAREVAGQYGPVLLSGVVASGGLLVDQSMAAMLPAGSVSALVYANRFVSVVITLLAGAVSTAIVPYFSRMIAHRDWSGCRHTLRIWVRLTALVSVPVAALLIAGARPLVRVAFSTAISARATPPSFPQSSPCTPFRFRSIVTSRVYYRFLVAMRRTDLILYCGVLNLGLDIVLNLVLMRWFGVAGIALATSLWTVSTLFYLWYLSRKLLARADAQEATA